MVRNYSVTFNWVVCNTDLIVMYFFNSDVSNDPTDTSSLEEPCL